MNNGLLTYLTLNILFQHIVKMNFSPFGVPLTAALPVATQFSAGKITQSVTTPNGQVVGVLQGGENGVHYIRPLDANAFASASTQQSQVDTVVSFILFHHDLHNIYKLLMYVIMLLESLSVKYKLLSLLIKCDFDCPAYT